MKATSLILKRNLRASPFTLVRQSLLAPSSFKGFKQVNNLHDIVQTAKQEKEQRSAKFVEYTNKVYKPSKTITFDRQGEVLLYSCDNIKHSQIYLKYPYVMYDSMIPLAAYNFFVDPCKLIL